MSVRPKEAPLRRALAALPFTLLAASAPLRGEADRPEDDLAAALARVRGSAVRAHVQFLADDLLEGRQPGTRGYEIAARYVASELEGLGLRPGGEGGTYFQSVPLLESTLREGELSLTTKTATSPVSLVAREDYLMSGDALRLEAEVEAPVALRGLWRHGPRASPRRLRGSGREGQDRGHPPERPGTVSERAAGPLRVASPEGRERRSAGGRGIAAAAHARGREPAALGPHRANQRRRHRPLAPTRRQAGVHVSGASGWGRLEPGGNPQALRVLARSPGRGARPGRQGPVHRVLVGGHGPPQEPKRASAFLEPQRDRPAPRLGS